MILATISCEQSEYSVKYEIINEDKKKVVTNFFTLVVDKDATTNILFNGGSHNDFSGIITSNKLDIYFRRSNWSQCGGDTLIYIKNEQVENKNLWIAIAKSNKSYPFSLSLRIDKLNNYENNGMLISESFCFWSIISNKEEENYFMDCIKSVDVNISKASP